MKLVGLCQPIGYNLENRFWYEHRGFFKLICFKTHIKTTCALYANTAKQEKKGIKITYNLKHEQ